MTNQSPERKAEQMWPSRPEISRPQGFYDQIRQAQADALRVVKSGGTVDEGMQLLAAVEDPIRSRVQVTLDQLSQESDQNQQSITELESFQNWLTSKRLLTRTRLMNIGKPPEQQLPEQNTQPVVIQSEKPFPEWAQNLEQDYKWANELASIESSWEAKFQDIEHQVSVVDESSARNLYSQAREVLDQLREVTLELKALKTAYENFHPSAAEIAVAADFSRKSRLLAERLKNLEALSKQVKDRVANIWLAVYEKHGNSKKELDSTADSIHDALNNSGGPDELNDLLTLFEDQSQQLDSIQTDLNRTNQGLLNNDNLNANIDQKLKDYLSLTDSLKEEILVKIFDLWVGQIELSSEFDNLKTLSGYDESKETDALVLQAQYRSIIAEISKFKAVAQVPPKVPREKFDDKIAAWVKKAQDKAALIEQRIKKLDEDRNFGEKAISKYQSEISELITSLDSLNGEIEEIRSTAKPIYTKILSARREIQKLSASERPRVEAEITRLEIEAFKLEYKKTRKELLRQLNDLEGREPGGEDLNRQTRRYDERFLRRMEELSALLGDSKYIEDVENCKTEKSARISLYYHWRFFWGNTSSTRRIPEVDKMKANETLPLSADQIDWIIKGGLKDKTWGDVTNEIVEPDRKTFWLSRDVEGQFDQVEYEATLVGDVMRRIDDIYLGKHILNTESATPVDVLSLNKYIPDHFVTLVAKDMGLKDDQIAIVRRAFRLHWCVTLHQSYLVAESNPQTADDYFYAFRWPRYLSKYRKTSVDTTNLPVSFLMFGLEGAEYFEHDVIKKIETAMKAAFVDLEVLDDKSHEHHIKGSLWDVNTERAKVKGFGSFRWMAGAEKGAAGHQRFVPGFPIFKLEGRSFGFRRKKKPIDTPDATVNAENQIFNNEVDRLNKIGLKDDGYSFAPPLCWWLWREQQSDGTWKVVRFPDSEKDGVTRKGDVITFDLMRDSEDRYLYEKMNFSQLAGNAMYDYISNFANGPAKVMSNILRKKKDDFEKAGESAVTVGEWRNALKYAVDFFPTVGPRILANEENSAQIRKMIWNEVSLTVILAFLLTKTDVAEEHFWGANQLNVYLNKLQGAGLIDDEDRKVLKLVSYDIDVLNKAFAKVMVDFKKQVEEAAKVR